jgi:hypothetical protein
MWTSKRRKKLLERAKKHEALVVMGCEAAVETVRNSVESTTCQVIQGMKSEGIMSIQPKFSLPCNIRLELESVTPYIHRAAVIAGRPSTNRLKCGWHLDLLISESALTPQRWNPIALRHAVAARWESSSAR